MHPYNARNSRYIVFVPRLCTEPGKHSFYTERVAQSVFKSNLTKTVSWFRQLVCLINCRYSQNGVKVTTPVEFPLEGLDMSEYTHLDPCEQCLYDLTGCVYHQGSKYFVNDFYPWHCSFSVV